MNRKTAGHLLLWLCVAAWMVLIFYFSAQPADVSSGQSGSTIRMLLELFYPNFESLSAEAATLLVDGFQHIVRKCAHFSIYTMLGFWLTNALFSYRRRPLPSALLAWGIAIAYAATDEFHQLFVEGRSCELRDVCIDSGGALLGITVTALVWTLIRYLKKRKQKKSS